MEGCQYRSIHQELMRDLLRLSTSTYSQVSSREQVSQLNNYILHITHQNFYWSHRGFFPPLCQVRSRAQNVLFTALGTYNFCCRDLIPHVLKFLDPNNSSVTQQQFKVWLFSLSNTSVLFSFKMWKQNSFERSLYFFRVPYTAFWGTTVECAWPTCTTGSALLWRGLLLCALASAQPCLWRSPPLCASSMISLTKSIASMRPLASTSR